MNLIQSLEKEEISKLAKGKRKHLAILSALKGRMINGLITDEATARYLLSV